MFLRKVKVILLGGALLFAGSVCAEQAQPSYEVLEIEDGDTLLIDIAGKPERVQIRGIDAPENTRNAKFNLDVTNTGLSEAELLALGEAAATHLNAILAPGATVQLEADLQSRDKYGRILAVVGFGGERTLAETMVLEGYAVPLPDAEMDRDDVTRLDRLERFARKKGNGLWSSHAETMHNWYDRTR